MTSLNSSPTPPTPTPASTTPIHLASPGGASVRLDYMERTLKLYPVDELQLKTLAALNTGATLFFSLGTGLLSFAVGQIFNIAIAVASATPPANPGNNPVTTPMPTTTTPPTYSLVNYTIGAFIILSILMYAIAICLLRYRNSELTTIKATSRSKAT